MINTHSITLRCKIKETLK